MSGNASDEKIVSEVFPLIKEWNIKFLQVGKLFTSSENKNCNRIIEAISDIKFNGLKSLYLYSNEITSIEQLSRIDLPNLQSLLLSIIPLIKIGIKSWTSAP